MEGMRVSMDDADFKQVKFTFIVFTIIIFKVGWRMSHNFRERSSWNNSRIARENFGRTQRYHVLFFGNKTLSEIDWDRFVADSKDFGAQILNGIRDFGSDN